jgi:hypothetical protein
MKRMLLLIVSLLLGSSVATADHIGIYSDATGTTCVLSSGVTTTSAVIHKFSQGATGSRWHIDASDLTGTIVTFSTPYSTVGSVNSDLTVDYGTCLSGSIVLGTLLMNATGGTLSVRPALFFTDILYADCSFGEHYASGGHACVACSDPCGVADATEAATWGSVKALYR